MRIALALVCAAMLAGCGTVGGWFGLGGSTPAKPQPAELVEFRPSLTLTRAWEAQVGAGRAGAFSPASDGQAIYAAGAGGQLVKLDLVSGRELWRVDSKEAWSAGVGVGEGLVLVGTPKGEVIAYRADSGQPAWRTRLGGEVLSTPVAAQGLVAVRGNDGKVWLLSATDGKTRWMYNRALPALILREPAELLLTDQALYAGFPGGKLVALALNNGAPIWETNVVLPKGTSELERMSDVTGALAADGRLVCAATYQGRIGCFDQATGNPYWARDFSGLSGVAMSDRYLYTADEQGILLAYDKQRGAGLWRSETLRGRGLGTPLVLTGNRVAVADAQGMLHVLGAEEGTLLGRASTDGSRIAGRMLGLDRGLVAQTANGGVYAFKIQ
ncbi:MAG: outer membrane protein assembly factor BamB [Pseudomonadota bacterium]